MTALHVNDASILYSLRINRVYSKRISFCISPRAVWYYSLPWGVYSNVRREMIDPIGELYGLDEGQSGQSKCALTWAEQRAGQPSVSKRRKRLVLAGGSNPGFEYTLFSKSCAPRSGESRRTVIRPCRS